MKEKILVTYSVQYCKEVELEVTEEIKEVLDRNEIIDWDKYDHLYNILSTQDEDLPIPTLVCVGDNEYETVEYVDGSFDIETFEKII